MGMRICEYVYMQMFVCVNIMSVVSGRREGGTDGGDDANERGRG